MRSPDVVLEVIDALNEAGDPYILTGSLASNVYATPRSTLDGDFVVDMAPSKFEKLCERLERQFDREPQMTFETVTGKTQHKFRHRQTRFLIEIFEAKLDDPHERSRLERRKSAMIEGHAVSLPTAEDVVVQKLRWFKQIRRVKDRDDVRSVLVYQWEALDWPYLERWCREHGTLELLETLMAEVRAELERTD